MYGAIYYSSSAYGNKKFIGECELEWSDFRSMDENMQDAVAYVMERAGEGLDGCSFCNFENCFFFVKALGDDFEDWHLLTDDGFLCVGFVDSRSRWQDPSMYSDLPSWDEIEQEV